MKEKLDEAVTWKKNLIKPDMTKTERGLNKELIQQAKTFFGLKVEL